MNWSINDTELIYKNKIVKGKLLKVESTIPVNIEIAWDRVRRSSTLQFVAKGMMTFRPLGNGFPEYWEVGKKAKTRTYLWGLIPMGGIHTITFQKIDRCTYTLQTSESDFTAKVWNHTIILEVVDETSIRYKDHIEIFAGWLTGVVAWWAKHFYIHRQQR